MKHKPAPTPLSDSHHFKIVLAFIGWPTFLIGIISCWLSTAVMQCMISCAATICGAVFIGAVGVMDAAIAGAKIQRDLLADAGQSLRDIRAAQQFPPQPNP